VKQAVEVLVLFYCAENRRRDVISLNQPRGMSAKMSAPTRDAPWHRGHSNP